MDPSSSERAPLDDDSRIATASRPGAGVAGSRPGMGDGAGARPGAPAAVAADRAPDDRARELRDGRLRLLRTGLLTVALGALLLGLVLAYLARTEAARLVWVAGTAPVAAALAVSIVKDLASGKMGVDLIAWVSMTAALVLGQPLAGIVVAVMYAGGTALEDFAMARAERDLTRLSRRAPRIAHRIRDGRIESIAIGGVEPGDRLLVQAGEILPVDGLVEAEDARIDEAVVTGEPLPVVKARGDPLRSGTVNAGEPFEMCATARAVDSTYAGIVRMVHAAASVRAPTVRLADRFALAFTPIVFAVAALAGWLAADPLRALAVLVVATPCPLILAAPVAFIAGVSRAARRGILIKGGGPLEALATVRTAMFDKTGTLTVGGARLAAIETAPGSDPGECLRLAASLLQASHHVVAGALIAAARERDMTLTQPSDMAEERGTGLRGTVEGRRLSAGALSLAPVGAADLPWVKRALRRADRNVSLTVAVSIDGAIAAIFLLADALRPEAPAALRRLRGLGLVRLTMVTGDHAAAADAAAIGLGLDAIRADRNPAEKIDAVRREQAEAPVLMVGDGINDAPALTAAAVGVAMGARGASASSDTADVVLLVDNLHRIPDAIAIARRSRRIAMQSILVGLSASLVAMGFAAFGWLSPVQGALLQEVIDVAVILNALRALGGGFGSGDGHLIAEPEALRIRNEHRAIAHALDDLAATAEMLEVSTPEEARRLIAHAADLVRDHILTHERTDEAETYPNRVAGRPYEAMVAGFGHAHGEIFRLARTIERLEAEMDAESPDPLAIREARRAIEAIVVLERLHNRQEEALSERD